MIAFRDYVRISGNYCLCYLGRSLEYLVQMNALMPKIRDAMTGVNVFLCTRDEDFRLVADLPLTLRYSDLPEIRHTFAHIKEITFETGHSHPVEAIALDAGVTDFRVAIPEKVATTKAVVVAKSSYPTRDLTASEVRHLERLAVRRGFEVGESVEGAGWVVGVESPELFQAGVRGIAVTLVPTGVGAGLFSRMFPEGEVLILPQSAF